MTKKLVWRLSKAPTVDELKTAVEAGIISKDEAKEMLVRNEEDIPKDQLAEIKDEIKLLRELVLNLSDKVNMRGTIEIIEKHYHNWGYYNTIRPVNPWYKPYEVWCNANSFDNPVSFSGNTILGESTSMNMGGSTSK